MSYPLSSRTSSGLSSHLPSPTPVLPEHIHLQGFPKPLKGGSITSVLEPRPHLFGVCSVEQRDMFIRTPALQTTFFMLGHIVVRRHRSPAGESPPPACCLFLRFRNRSRMSMSATASSPHVRKDVREGPETTKALGTYKLRGVRIKSNESSLAEKSKFVTHASEYTHRTPERRLAPQRRQPIPTRSEPPAQTQRAQQWCQSWRRRQKRKGVVLLQSKLPKLLLQCHRRRRNDEAPHTGSDVHRKAQSCRRYRPRPLLVS